MTRLTSLIALAAVLALGAAPALSDQDVWTQPCSACDTDFDDDGDTDDDDLAIFRASMGLSEGDPGFDAACDCNQDGVVGGPDMACVLENASSN